MAHDCILLYSIVRYRNAQYSIQCIEYVMYIVKVWNVDPGEIFININSNVNLTGSLKLYTKLCFVINLLLAMFYKKS